jgi:nucleotide-binding universal stress UspA family protein
MFRNVLVGVDGRPAGRDAIALGSRLVDPEGRLTLVHVHSGILRPSHAITPAMVKEDREASAQLLERERAAEEVRAELVSVESMTPGRGLHQQAEELGCDLLVVGSCRRGAFGRAMLGDDTRAALNGAPCAVAVASVGYAEHPTPPARIGVGYDGSPESRAALEAARSVAAATRASIHVLEVVSIPVYAYTGMIPPLTGETMDTMVDEATEKLQELEGVEGRAVTGLVGEELAAFGDDLDLLVVGSRGYGPAKRLVIGSTSDYLERHARCSLLVLPRTAARAEGSRTDAAQGAETEPQSV